MTFKPEYVTLIDSMGTDLTTVNSARVSFSKVSNWAWEVFDFDEDDNSIPTGERALEEKDAKLINYLAKHHHWTPFSQNAITLRIKMPIFVERQWMKSQIGFTRNSESRRYISTEPEFWIPTEWRMAAKDKKQGSSDEVKEIDDICATTKDGDWIFLEDMYANSLSYYKDAIEKGIAPEQARMILPQSMFTTFIETASLAAYARLVKLRTTPDAQSEIRDYANRVSEIMGELFPVSWKALMEN
jgi:thymidylate synthase (FAD)